MNERKIAKRVAASFIMDLVEARERQSMEHPSEEARKKYLKDHPGADPSNHKVKKTESKGPAKKEAPKSKSKKEYKKDAEKTQQFMNESAQKLGLQNGQWSMHSTDPQYADVMKAYNTQLEVKNRMMKTDEGDSKFADTAAEYEAATEKLKGAVNKVLDAESDKKFKKEAPKDKGPANPHKKKSVSQKAVKKVSNIMKEHDLTADSDELKELAGFKSTLGQRIPEKNVGDWYVRNVQTLKSDFLKNMSPANYSSPEAFKNAKERMKKMPAGDFAKILAAMTDDED
jgi:hypothetical protein